MHRIPIILLFVFFVVINTFRVENFASDAKPITQTNEHKHPLGASGLRLTYSVFGTKTLPGSVVKTFELALGPVEQRDGAAYQWLQVHATKENRETFTVWLLCSRYPSKSLKIAQAEILRYILQKGDARPVEFRRKNKDAAVLPNTGAWLFLLPRSQGASDPVAPAAERVRLLGHEYRLERKTQAIPISPPAAVDIVALTPELLIGVPHNTLQKDDTRRYDRSDYEYVRLTRADYAEMIEAGLNCFRVDAEQASWIERSDVYYWGIGGEDVPYPECLYQSNYIGPALFFDEPMVRTRDHVIKPKLKKDPALRKSLTPQKVLQDFKKVYHETKYEGAPTALLKGLAERKDVDIGDMSFLQQNMYTWETMVSSALYQLSEGDAAPPYAMVFEPPGRFGTLRVLPELNMCFDCQIPIDAPNNLIDIIYGFLRGAARVTGRAWGTSIYGAVDRADASWFLTHAYDLGASLFFYWDTYQLACVPYHEYLAMTRHLRAHAENFPNRNVQKLKKAAEVAILLPPGYNLGHVYMGRGVFSALPELNLERTNSYGVTYRQVMSNFYVEIERCIRLGVAYDLFWNLENLNLRDYREIVTIREDGKVQVIQNGQSKVLDSARTPHRPDGEPPQLSVEVAVTGDAPPYLVTARARVVETSAPVFYTKGADRNGVYRNQYVLWELFGPQEEDYSNLWQETWNVAVSEQDGQAEVELKFRLDRPGDYRLRAATSDVAGRSSVVWKEFQIKR